MSEKRVLIRTETTEDYGGTPSEQESLVDDVENMLAGSGISGHIIAGPGRTWLEWEGEDDVVNDAVDTYVNDSRIGAETIFEETAIDTRNSQSWHGHCEAHAYQ